MMSKNMFALLLVTTSSASIASERPIYPLPDSVYGAIKAGHVPMQQKQISEVLSPLLDIDMPNDQVIARDARLDCGYIKPVPGIYLNDGRRIERLDVLTLAYYRDKSNQIRAALYNPIAGGSACAGKDGNYVLPKRNTPIRLAHFYNEKTAKELKDGSIQGYPMLSIPPSCFIGKTKQGDLHFDGQTKKFDHSIELGFNASYQNSVDVKMSLGKGSYFGGWGDSEILKNLTYKLSSSQATYDLVHHGSFSPSFDEHTKSAGKVDIDFTVDNVRKALDKNVSDYKVIIDVELVCQ